MIVGDLLEQADGLCAPSFGRRTREVDLRRAISTAYYGLFHYVLTEVADAFVGPAVRNGPRYVLVYRSVNHADLKTTCAEIQKPRPSDRYAPYAPAEGFDASLKQFASGLIDLQISRHRADYDPGAEFQVADARLAVAKARSAIGSYEAARKDQREMFLTLLLCPPR